MDQPSVSHDGFVFKEIGVPPTEAIRRDLKHKRAQLDKTEAQRAKARQIDDNFQEKVQKRIQSQKQSIDDKIQALIAQHTLELARFNAEKDNAAKIVEEKLSKTQDYAKAQSARQDVESLDENLFQTALEIQELEDAQFNAELFQDLKGREKEALQDPVFQEQIRILAEKLKAEKREAKEKARQAERDEKQAKRKKEKEKIYEEKQRLKREEKKAREEIRAAEKAQAQAQKLQERLFKKKYKGKIFYFENPDQVGDTQFLTRINNERSYYQNFTSFFTGGSNFYYLADDKISAYDFDVSALRIIAEPYLKSLDNGVTFEYGKNLSDGERDWQGFLEDLQDNNYYMKDKPWSLKNAEKFARGMDNVFKSDPRAQKNTDVESAKGQNVRYGVAFDKSMGAGHFVFKTKKEKIIDESAMEEDDQDGEFSVYEKKEYDLGRNSSSESESDSDDESVVGFVDDDDDYMNEISSNISSALDLIKI